MEERRYESSPSYGFIRKEYKRFNDIKHFNGIEYLFVFLKKIKLWYGTPAKGDNNLDTKAILGIEAEYRVINRKTVKAESHLSKIESNDIQTKELSLKNDDYFTKIYICCDDIISYIKLESLKGEKIELGSLDEKLLKKISFNDAKNPHVIQYFYGFIDDYGLRALGFRHVPKASLLIMNQYDIFRFRHLIKQDEKKKEFWENKDNLKDLDTSMKAIAKLVFLPDSLFSFIIKFLAE